MEIKKADACAGFFHMLTICLVTIATENAQQ